MTEEISVRIANSKKEYLKTIVPVSFTNNIADAYVAKCEPCKMDYDWVKNNVLNVIEKIYINDKVQTLVVWCFDSLDNDFVEVTLVYDPAGALRGAESWDPVAVPKLSAEMHAAATMLLENLRNEISDIFLRCLSSTSILRKTLTEIADVVGATIPGASTWRCAERGKAPRRSFQRTNPDMRVPCCSRPTASSTATRITNTTVWTSATTAPWAEIHITARWEPGRSGARYPGMSRPLSTTEAASLTLWRACTTCRTRTLPPMRTCIPIINGSCSV